MVENKFGVTRKHHWLAYRHWRHAQRFTGDVERVASGDKPTNGAFSELRWWKTNSVVNSNAVGKLYPLLKLLWNFNLSPFSFVHRKRQGALHRKLGSGLGLLKLAMCASQNHVGYVVPKLALGPGGRHRESAARINEEKLVTLDSDLGGE